MGVVGVVGPAVSVQARVQVVVVVVVMGQAV